MLLVVVEHDRGGLAAATEEALTFGRDLAAHHGVAMHAISIGAAADGLAAVLAAHGVVVVHQAHHDALADYGPEAWGETVAQLVRSMSPSIVLATGTDRGNEVMAQAAARLDLPMVANVTEVDPLAWEVVRVRWGGSLLERAAVHSDTKLLTVAHHTVEASRISAGAGDPEVVEFVPVLGAAASRTVVRDRVERVAGVTLATAPVVVGGGRGVGSAEGFAPLEELASLLGGVVGCSRAVTNNGWRNHTDQVGQTGTRIAPELYFACGISGAIQHWVGAMASKRILAINIDPEANMVTKADYAVIGDLHQVVPAISAEIRRRRG
ncbi:MAG: electron transfer flavoprotein subunit alpha/FixB family protein [Acidimicrobiia bacterium]